MMNKALLQSLTAFALLLAPVGLAADDGVTAAEDGVLTILAVPPSSRAEAAGVESGDRLLEIAGESVGSLDDVMRCVERLRPGDIVPIEVERGGEVVPLRLELGEHKGRTSLGVSLALMTPEGAAQFIKAQAEGVDASQCLDWIDERYRMSSVAATLDLDLGTSTETLRDCMLKDLHRMPARIPREWCDNVFKVHCSGLDLLTSIGEAQVLWCEEVLEESLGVDLRQTRAWTACAENKIFDRFSVEGLATDEAACRAALDDCGFEPDGGSR